VKDEPAVGAGFDVVVIGAGPAAVAALDALDGGQNIAVITGAVPSSEKRRSLHPKIQALSISLAEAAGVSERIDAITNSSRPLFSTAAVGGLANYWGQQFVRWQDEDPWPRDAFTGFDDYLHACARIERLFSLEGGEPLDSGLAGHGFASTKPRLLLGSAAHAGTGFGAMRLAFEAAAQNVSARVISARARSFARERNRWTIALDDGSRITAARVLLAAGVIGDGQLLLRSFPDLQGLQFADHAPWILYTIGLKRHLPPRPGGYRREFNALTVEKTSTSGCSLFASIYDIRGADLNLVLASAIGRSHSWLRHWPSPPGTGFITPVQVWTPKTYGRVDVAGSDGKLSFQPDIMEAGFDPDLAEFLSRISSLGGKVLRKRRTVPAFGYHYHRLRLRPRGSRWVDVGEFLLDRTGSGVTCIDAADLTHIGCRPHTLTVMARASVKARGGAEPAAPISPRVTDLLRVVRTV